MARLTASTCSKLAGPIRPLTLTISAAPSATSACVRMPADFPRSSRSSPMPDPISVAMKRRSATSPYTSTCSMLHLRHCFASGEQSGQPEFGQFLQHRVLAKAGAQIDEVDFIELLSLIEAREDERFFSADRIDMPLQALRADLLHHVLHRRVDRPDADVLRIEMRRQDAVARVLHRAHHSVR